MISVFVIAPKNRTTQ